MDGGKEQPHEDPDDRNYHQQFDQCEASRRRRAMANPLKAAPGSRGRRTSGFKGSLRCRMVDLRVAVSSALLTARIDRSRSRGPCGEKEATRSFPAVPFQVGVVGGTDLGLRDRQVGRAVGDEVVPLVAGDLVVVASASRCRGRGRLLASATGTPSHSEHSFGSLLKSLDRQEQPLRPGVDDTPEHTTVQIRYSPGGREQSVEWGASGRDGRRRGGVRGCKRRRGRRPGSRRPTRLGGGLILDT